MSLRPRRRMNLRLFIIIMISAAAIATLSLAQQPTKSAEFEKIIKNFTAKVDKNVQFTEYGTTEYDTGEFSNSVDGMKKYLNVIHGNPDYWNFYVQANELALMGKTADDELRLLRKKYPDNIDAKIMDRYWKGVFKLPAWDISMKTPPSSVDYSVTGTVLMLVRNGYHYQSVIFLRQSPSQFNLPLPANLKIRVHPLLHKYGSSYIYVLVCTIGDNPLNPLGLEIVGQAVEHIPATMGGEKDKWDWTSELVLFLEQKSVDVVCFDHQSRFIFKRNVVFDSATLSKMKKIKDVIQTTPARKQTDEETLDAINDYQSKYNVTDFGL